MDISTKLLYENTKHVTVYDIGYAFLMYKRGDKDEAKIYFEKEYLTYPESKTYIQSLMEKLGL